MYIEFDSLADALYVRFKNADGPVDSDPLDDFRIVDYDVDGSIVGIEFIVVSKGIDLSGVPQAERIAEVLRSLPHPTLA